ncbi:MAG: metalloprotease TldD [Gammaproteobacteria bacterium]|nr:metalloprotease TldD [Gammaproteobacteria bacterium]
MNDHIFNLAQEKLLAPAALTVDQLQNILGDMMQYQLDYADLYFEMSFLESWGLEEGMVKNGNYSVDRGVGIRAISGDKTGFAYSDDIDFSALTKASKAARAIASRGGKNQVFIPKRIAGLHLYETINPISLYSEQDKINLLQVMDREARKQDPRVSQVMVSLASSYQIMLVVATDGTLSADVRPLMRLNIHVIAEDTKNREMGSSGGGGRSDFDYEFICQKGRVYAQEAVRQALINLEAKPAPAGTMPVVLGEGWPGVLLHEAVGHGLESDFIRKKTSVFTGCIGKQVASPLCTVVDDGTLAGRRGSLNVDDEGSPSQCTVLIENGILNNYMFDKLNARMLGARTTANARRESYAHLPIPRMTNTYMLAGKHSPEEIIKSIDKGLYAVNFSGGQVDITSGQFVFSTSEAYYVEKGKIQYPVKGATLIGRGSEVLKKISMVGNQLELDTGVGICGKAGQSVPVGVGQPMLKVDELTVGGTV